MPRLPPRPELSWSDDDAPSAPRFGDVYFSREGGLKEAEAVFLQGCGLPEAWRGRAHFSLCELGFGTGLNILAVWRAWKLTRSPHAQLHISTVEAFPLARVDAARALAAFPEIAELAERLLARWPVRAAGPQRLRFDEDNFALTILHGEAEAVLEGIVGQFDAWFLDGFAPARNPAMWTPALMRRIAALSAPGARLASFTVAGEVRRALEAAGFEVAKRPGFAAKRERLEARLLAPPARAPESQPIYPYAEAHPRRVAIVGAGIAGAACAHALARRGVEAVVLEAARDLGAGASGNPAGLVMPRLDRGGPLSELHLAAYLDAVAHYCALGVFEPCGVVQYAEPERQAALDDLIADPPLPPDWFAPYGAGVLHARAGTVRPRAALAAMLAHAQIVREAEIGALAPAGAGWIVRALDGRALLKADAVVLACGPGFARFAPAAFLPLQLSYGQVEWGRAKAPAHALARSAYVAPLPDGVLFGATFDKAPAPEDEARARNLAALARLAPEIAASIEPGTLRSRASVRVTTPDRAPIAGLLPDAEAWRAQFAALAHGRPPESDAPPPAHAGVYVLGALGARGMTLAPILGERIAAEICGEAQALSRFALDAIHPARFLHRALKRR